MKEKRTRTGDEAATVKKIIAQHGSTRDALVPILSDVNRELGYIPAKALGQVAQALEISQSQIFSVATFYSMLSVQPRGRHVIQFCESAPCHVAGGQTVLDRLQSELGLRAGETSADGKWTLRTTSCIGLCSVAPLVIVDEDLFGNVTPDQVPDILARYA